MFSSLRRFFRNRRRKSDPPAEVVASHRAHLVKRATVAYLNHPERRSPLRGGGEWWPALAPLTLVERAKVRSLVYQTAAVAAALREERP